LDVREGDSGYSVSEVTGHGFIFDFKVPAASYPVTDSKVGCLSHA